ncbi:hypothetical protein [Natronorubrum bangense]|uniref:Transporter n=1 Tax=Natronorubrum bangense JCM 10635 TaxID=1227500 RepID=L9VZQ3_9EURY|nr:hypothetical protein [Natronorubrum bangense]ELY42690.1 hypothetical protein C494_20348 [Natronorubrum bangense JCM 10635]
MSYRWSRKPETLSSRAISGAIVAGLLASVSFGGMLAATGHLEAVATVYGLEGHDWLLVIIHGLLGAVVFVAGLTHVANHRYAPVPLAAALRSPFLGGCFGVAYGTACWLAIVAYGLPLWMGATGGHLPLPYQHGPSLLAFIGYGTVLGAWYPLVRTAIDD